MDSIYNILIFFAEKMCKSNSHFFSKIYQHICASLDVNFNKSLTNDVLSFEQLGPEVRGPNSLTTHFQINTAENGETEAFFQDITSTFLPVGLPPSHFVALIIVGSPRLLMASNFNSGFKQSRTTFAQISEYLT